MKVMITAGAYWPDVIGGGEISTRNLALALRDQGVEVVVVAASNEDQQEIVDGIRVMRLKAPNVYWHFAASRRETPAAKKAAFHMIEAFNPWAFFKLRVVMVRERPDIVHVSTVESLSAMAFRAAAACGIPVVHTLRSYSLVCISASMVRNGKQCVSQCRLCRLVCSPKKMLSRSVDGVIGTSRYILQRHLDLGLFADAERCVIRNIREPSDVKLERLPRHQLTFGYIGRLGPLKGVELLVDAFRTSRLRSDTRLLIAGRGKPEYEANLRAQTTDLPIDWLGWIDPANFYRRVDVTVVPSLWPEPLGGVVIEAHCCGVPTVVSAHGGLPEMVEDGKTGFIYRRDTVEELARTLLRFVDEPHLANAMRPSIIEAAKRYAAPVIAREHLELYDMLLCADFLKRPSACRHQ